MMAASNSFDAEAFLGVPSQDLVRVSVDRNEVYGMDRHGLLRGRVFSLHVNRS